MYTERFQDWWGCAGFTEDRLVNRQGRDSRASQ